MSLDIYFEEMQPVDVFQANVTHNLVKMAKEADLYECLWRAEENGLEQAKDLVEPVTKGLAILRADPERFRKFNPENGWGSYDYLVEFCESVLGGCAKHPEARVRTWA